MHERRHIQDRIGPVKGYLRLPRRARCGVSALGATLLLALVVSAGFAAWQASEAERLRDAYLKGLDRWVRAEAAALHHFLHDAQKSPSFTQPAAGASRPLSAQEHASLRDWRPDWLTAPEGWSVRRFVTTPRLQVNDPAGNAPRAHGGLTVTPRGGGSGPDRTTRAILQALCLSLLPDGVAPDGVAAKGVAQGGVASSEAQTGCNHGGDPAMTVFAAPLAGIDPNRLLREARSGFAPPTMGTALHMGGHTITARSVITKSVTAPVLRPPRSPGNTPAGSRPVRIDGNLTSQGALTAAGIRAGGGEAAGRLTVEGTAGITGRVDVTGTLGGKNADVVGLMHLTGPGPAPGIRTLSTERCTGC